MTYQKESSSRQAVTTSFRFIFIFLNFSLPGVTYIQYWRSPPFSVMFLNAGGLVFSLFFQVAVGLPRFDKNIELKFGCCCNCLFSGHEFSSQEPLYCSVVHENGDHSNGWRRRHQIETGQRSDRQWRRSPTSTICLDWWRCYPTRFLRLSCRFTFDFLFFSLLFCYHDHFPFLPQWSFQMDWKSGGTAWAGRLPWQKIISFSKVKHFPLFVLLLLIFLTLLFNCNSLLRKSLHRCSAHFLWNDKGKTDHFPQNVLHLERNN